MMAPTQGGMRTIGDAQRAQGFTQVPDAVQ